MFYNLKLRKYFTPIVNSFVLSSKSWLVSLLNPWQCCSFMRIDRCLKWTLQGNVSQKLSVVKGYEYIMKYFEQNCGRHKVDDQKRKECTV